MFEIMNEGPAETKRGALISYENEIVMKDILSVLSDYNYHINVIYGMDDLVQDMFLKNRISVAIVERSRLNGQTSVFDRYLKMMNVNIPMIVIVDGDEVAKDRTGKMDPSHHYLINRSSSMKQLPEILNKILHND